ncbi:MAG: hypothetical protein QM790_19080 [Nibricoccus sp.]
MHMKIHRKKINLLFLGICCCGVTAWWLGSFRHERMLARKLDELRRRNAVIASKIERGKDEYAKVRAAVVPEGMLSPEQKRRLRVAQLVEQIKLERANRTTPIPPPPPEGPRGNTFRELMDDPEYVRLVLVIRKYGWLAENFRDFRWANIPPEKQEKLCELILDRGVSADDVMAVAQKNGLADEQAWKLREQVLVSIEDEIKSLLGQETYEKFRQAPRSYADELIKSLQIRLSYSDTPLNKEQKQQLYEAILKCQIPRRLKPEQVTPLIERAAPVLTSEQQQAFHQVVNEYNLGKGEDILVVRDPKK